MAKSREIKLGGHKDSPLHSFANTSPSNLTGEPQMQTIQSELQSDKNALAPLMRALKKSEQLDQQFKQCVNAEIAHHCQAIFYHDNCLGLQIGHSAYAAKLRFLEKSVIRDLQKTSYFNEIQTIKVMIKTEHTDKDYPPLKTPSQQAFINRPRTPMPEYFKKLKK